MAASGELSVVVKPLHEYLQQDELFLDEIDEELRCGICTSVFQDPHAVCGEGHIFCLSCLRKVQSKHTRSNNSTCPMCRVPLLPQPVPSRTTRSLIDKLRLCCPNKKAHICPWTGPSSQLLGHLAVCDFQPVTCEYEVAMLEHKQRQRKRHRIQPNLVLRGELEQHKRSCPYRPISCLLGCGVVHTLGNQEKHETRDCRLRMISCPELGCQEEVVYCKRRHHAAKCPYAQVSCTFAPLGCRENVRRRDLLTHLQEAVVFHSKLTVQYQQAFEGTEERCVELEGQCDQLEGRCDQLEAKCEELEDRSEKMEAKCEMLLLTVRQLVDEQRQWEETNKLCGRLVKRVAALETGMIYHRFQEDTVFSLKPAAVPTLEFTAFDILWHLQFDIVGQRVDVSFGRASGWGLPAVESGTFRFYLDDSPNSGSMVSTTQLELSGCPKKFGKDMEGKLYSLGTFPLSLLVESSKYSKALRVMGCVGISTTL
eukprot:gb/GEZN01003399.1/.p1 GENE.gb/GEZN01003399.1/~~gb/GEZN01003399.1/.p1  ORF type:complete len:481 (-),score=46.08 gb/GEZN01003399.1/:562-2004(-)